MSRRRRSNQVRAGVGRLDRILDHVRQRRLDHLPRVVRLLGCPVPERRPEAVRPAMMTGEKLGVGHEPRHGTAYVSSWVKALQNDPREIRAAAVDAQKISDWLMARERERTAEQEPPSTEPANREDAMAPTPEREAMAVRVGNGGERAEEARGRTAAPQRDAGPSR